MGAKSGDMARAGREDAVRDLLDGFPVSVEDARGNARAFLREGDRGSARYWVAYARMVALVRVAS